MAVLALSQHCSLHEALRQARVLYDREMNHFAQVKDELLRIEHGQQDDLRRWIIALNDFHAGLINWSSGSVRYTLLPQSTWPTPDMIIDETGATEAARRRGADTAYER